MKIYGTKTVGNPIRVAIFLAEKGIEVPFEPVDLSAGASRTPDFLNKNPAAQIPVLELDDGTCVAETIAICRYFERLHPNPPLMGVDPLDEAIVEMWQRRIEFNLFVPAREVFRHTSPLVKVLEPVQIADWAALNRPRVKRGYQILDDQLASHAFVAGSRFTVADITGLYAVQMMRRVAGLEEPEKGRHVDRWYREVSARPSIASLIPPG